MPSPPPMRPTFTDVPAGRGIAAMDGDELGEAWTALGASAASHAWPPGPRTRTRRRTDPTPTVETRPR